MILFAPFTALADIEKRTIIGISNAQQLGYKLEQVETRQVAEMPLNHLGLRMVQYDWVGSETPSIELTASARGALIWFGGTSLEDPNAFLDWSIAFMESGKYIVLFGDVAFLKNELSEPADPIRLKRFFTLLGVNVTTAMLDDSESIMPRLTDSNLMNFERQTPDLLESAITLHAVPDISKTFFSIKDVNGEYSDVIAKTSGGGVALNRFGYTYYPAAEIGFWLVNPFEFFQQTFRVSDLPIPDTTTLNGRRIYFSHVDGDGWNSISSVPDDHGVRNISAQVMLDELIKPFPGMPVTVAAISGDLDTSLHGTRQSRLAATEIFAMPQVELGTHTHTHPFEWEYFDPKTYKAAQETKAFETPRQPMSYLERTAHRVSVSISADDNMPSTYVHSLYEIPRAYYDGPFALEKEIDGSVDIIEALAPAHKTVKLVQWPGDTSPYQDALKHVRDLGLENMNGGQTRYDPAFPSVSYISPLTRSVGAEIQVLTPMVSEAFYTQYWSSRYFGFQDLRRTIDNTESPIRLRPINIYYHAYSADRPSALNAVKENIAYSASQDIAPIAGSDYAKIVRGALSADLEQVSPGNWIITNRGALNTVRFDKPSLEHVDYSKSVGVLGHSWHQGSLYLSLDPTSELVQLAMISKLESGESPRPFLINSRWLVSDALFDPETVSFDVQGFGAGTMAWQFPSRCLAIARIAQAQGPQLSYPIPSSSSGRVTVALANAPHSNTKISLSCEPLGAHHANP